MYDCRGRRGDEGRDMDTPLARLSLKTSSCMFRWPLPGPCGWEFPSCGNRLWALWLWTSPVDKENHKVVTDGTNTVCVTSCSDIRSPDWVLQLCYILFSCALSFSSTKTRCVTGISHFCISRGWREEAKLYRLKVVCPMIRKTENCSYYLYFLHTSTVNNTVSLKSRRWAISFISVLISSLVS